MSTQPQQPHDRLFRHLTWRLSIWRVCALRPLTVEVRLLSVVLKVTRGCSVRWGLTRLLRLRFGDAVTQTHLDRVAAATVDQLTAWTACILTADSVDDTLVDGFGPVL